LLQARIGHPVGSLTDPFGHPIGSLLASIQQQPTINDSVLICSGHPYGSLPAPTPKDAPTVIDVDASEAIPDNVYNDISSIFEDNDYLSNYSIVSSTEVDNCNFLHEFGHTLDCYDNIFSPEEMDGLKKPGTSSHSKKRPRLLLL